ncbi:hypothetical protein T10_11650 [Trichinella papuae]|uniref:Uncharacterized protein n=1 Tax=Trichinella papuae TaxID=268474 RepID=A0A0V1MY33_9BILA|nr:hypothetical protein T10_11650 [Trichinella papuae]
MDNLLTKRQFLFRSDIIHHHHHFNGTFSSNEDDDDFDVGKKLKISQKKDPGVIVGQFAYTSYPEAGYLTPVDTEALN